MRRKLYYFCEGHLLYFGDVYVSFLISTLIHTFSCISDLSYFSHLTYFFTKAYLLRHFLYNIFHIQPFFKMKKFTCFLVPFYFKTFFCRYNYLIIFTLLQTLKQVPTHVEEFGLNFTFKL